MEMIEIPNKSMFKLNEVCGLVGVKPYVLRFWESEFLEIEPIISSSGQKLYEPRDIEAIAIIKKLLFDEKMNIEQAKAELPKRLGYREEVVQESNLQLENQSDDFIDDSVESFSDNTQEVVFDVNEVFAQEAKSSEKRDTSSLNISRMALSEADLDKLMMAKNLLREVVS